MEAEPQHIVLKEDHSIQVWFNLVKMLTENKMNIEQVRLNLHVYQQIYKGTNVTEKYRMYVK
jgi:hypothetical protein